MLILEVINENSLTQDVKAIIKSVYNLSCAEIKDHFLLLTCAEYFS